jgi:hypothetical protein
MRTQEVKGMTNVSAESLDFDEEKKTAEDYLIHYAAYKAEIEQYKLLIIESSPAMNDMPTREKYVHGNPTANKAIKLTRDDILRKERWLKATAMTRVHYAIAESDHWAIITMKYDMGMTAKQIALDLGIGKTSVFSFQNEVLSYLVGAHDMLVIRT